MNILISAYAFSPYNGSESAVGWNIATELAKLHNVTVLTGSMRFSDRKKKDIDCYLAEHKIQGRLTIEFVEPSKLISVLVRMHDIPGLWGLYYVAYRLWQKKAYRRVRELACDSKFDIVHHLNMIGYREPGYLWNLGIPFVWGPVGGAPNEPLSFHRMFSWSGCVKVALRTAINELQKRINWRARKAAKVARKIWAVTDADYRMIRNIWGVECDRMVETGTVRRDEGRVRKWDGNVPLKIVWSGIHTPRKALPILLYALARLNVQDWRCDILGEGPETRAWMALAERLCLSDRLIWHGKLPHDAALKIMDGGDVFAFPSLKEGTPHVVLEALSLGLPVICHDACGMGSVVTNGCGFKIPLRDPETSIAGFANTIQCIFEDPSVITVKSIESLKHAGELTWEMKAQKIAKAYEELANRKS